MFTTSVGVKFAVTVSAEFMVMVVLAEVELATESGLDAQFRKV